MTEDERSAGKWQGSIDAKVSFLDDLAKQHRDTLAAHGTKITKLEGRQSIMWSVLVALVGMVGSALFKLFTSGAF